MEEYNQLLLEKGIQVSLTPDLTVLSAEDTISAISLLEDTNVPILGGDVYSKEKVDIVPVHKIWGSKYHYLNWYTDQKAGENISEYVSRSYQESISGINEAKRIAFTLKRSCYFNLII